MIFPDTPSKGCLTLKSPESGGGGQGRGRLHVPPNRPPRQAVSLSQIMKNVKNVKNAKKLTPCLTLDLDSAGSIYPLRVPYEALEAVGCIFDEF